MTSDWRSRACGCVLLILLAGAPAFAQQASDQLTIRFAPGVVEAPPGRSAGTIGEFTFSVPLVRDALESAGVEFLARLFPDFRSEDRLSVNFIGEPVLLDDLSGYYLVSLRPGAVRAVDAQVRSIPGVIEAEWIPPRRALSADPLFPKQWGLENTQQALCTQYQGPPLVADRDINAPEAWAITTGVSSVRVGILDTGIHATHEDFGGRVNLADGVSFTPVMPVSDPPLCNGGSPDLPWDDNGHGTGVAGIAAASGQNGLGVAGVAWGVTPVAIKMMDCGASGGADKSAQAIDWARTHSIPVLSMSYGGFAPYGPERAAARNAFYAGALLVAASGNEDHGFPRFPARYANTVCAVGAYFANGRRWIRRVVFPNDPDALGGSCWGPALDLGAPGGSLIGTTGWGARLVNNAYDDLAICSQAFGGTSSAAPVVSGVAGLVLSKYSAQGASGTEPLLGEDVYQAMIRTARHPGSLDGHTVYFDDSTSAFFDDSTGYGHVRADTALKLLALPRKVYHQRVTAMTIVDTFLSVRTLLNIPGVPPDTYTVKTYVLRKAIIFNPAFRSKPMGWVRSSGTVGAKDVNPYDYDVEVYGGRIVRITATACTLETNVFKILRAAPPYDWFPILPPKARVALTTVGVPTGGGGGGASPGGRGRDTSGGEALPMSYALHQNRPNPFVRSTRIVFDLPLEAPVRLEIFDAQGRLVRTLANQQFPAGFHSVEWNQRAESGHRLGAGVYLYRIQAGSYRDQKKMVLLER